MREMLFVQRHPQALWVSAIILLVLCCMPIERAWAVEYDFVLPDIEAPQENAEERPPIEASDDPSNNDAAEPTRNVIPTEEPETSSDQLSFDSCSIDDHDTGLDDDGRSAESAIIQACAGQPAPLEDAVISESNNGANDSASLMAASATASGPLADGDYVIRSYVTQKKVLDVAWGSKKSGANVQLYEYNATAAQKWRIRYDAASGCYTIASLLSGKMLDVSGGSSKNGTNVQVYSPNGTKAQKWRITKSGTGWIIESALKNGVVLDIAYAGTTNGTNAQVYSSNKTNAQLFDLLALKPSVPTSTAQLAEGAYVVKSSASGKVLDVSNGSRSSLANIQQYKANSTYAQSFYLEPDGKGYYRVFNIGSGLALDVSNASLMPGTNVQQYAWNGTNAQLWSLRMNADKTYSLISKANGMALDISDASTANGANVQVYTPNGTKAQKFTLTSVDLLPTGPVKLLSAAAVNLAVGIASGSTSSGAGVRVASQAATPTQKFVVTKQGANRTFQSTCSSLYLNASGNNVVQSASATTWTTVFSKTGARRGLVISTADGKSLTASGTKSGSAVALAKTNGSIAQSFLPIYSALIDNGVYIVANANGGKVLDAANGKRVNGTNVQVYTSNGTNAQKFQFTSLGSEWYTIRNASSGRALDVTNGSKASGANVQLYKANGTAAQKWKAELLDGGNMRFVNALSGKVLEVEGAKNVNGANVRVADRSTSAGQKFRLTSTSLAKEAVNLGVPSIWQNPELPTGCESVALANALTYYGFKLSKTEIADRYMSWSGDDFVYSFMGNPHSEDGAAIMAPGITNAANRYLSSKGSSLRASNLTGSSFDSLYSYIDAGCPVVVWSTMYFGDRGSAIAWQDGYTMYLNTHAVTLAGYNANKTQVLVSDPLSGSVWREASRFRSLYDQMGKQAVVIQ